MKEPIENGRGHHAIAGKDGTTVVVDRVGGQDNRTTFRAPRYQLKQTGGIPFIEGQIVDLVDAQQFWLTQQWRRSSKRGSVSALARVVTR